MTDFRRARRRMSRFRFGAVAFLSLWPAALFGGKDVPFHEELRNADALTSAIIRSAGAAFQLNAQGLAILDSGGRPDNAIVFFEQALGILPNYTDALNNMGVAHFRKGEISRARDLWKSVLVHDKEYATAYHNLGISSYHEKDPARASSWFRAALKYNRKLLQSYVMLGRMLLEDGKVRPALECFEKAYRINPAHDDAWSNLAYGLIESGDTAKAQGVLRKHADHPEALGMLGTLEAKRNNVGRASEMLNSAVDRGGDPSLLLKLSSVQIDQGDCRSAVKTLTTYFTKTTAPEADAYLCAAMAAKECKNGPSAVRFLEEGVGRYSRDPLLLYNLGKLYFGDGRYDAAEEAWRVAADSLNDPELFYLRALCARRRDQNPRAEELVRQALARDSQARYHDLLGAILFSSGKKKEAEESFKRALEMDPNLQSAQLNLALVGKGPHDMSAAIRAADKERSQCRGPCVEPAVRLAILCFHAKDFARAAAVLESVSEPDRTETVYRMLALCYREAHELDKSINVLLAFRKRLARTPQTEQLLAETYLLAGYPAKAIDVLTELAGQSPEDLWRAHYQLGYAYMEQSQLQPAREHFEKSLKLNPKNTAGRGLLAFVLSRQGSMDQAAELWRKNLQDDPENPVVHINLGLAAETRGDFRSALEHYRKALRLRPEDNALHINIGNALRGLDKTAEALDSYQRGMESAKRDLAAYNIFLLAHKSGDHKRSAEMAQLLAREFAGTPYAGRTDAEMRLARGDTAGAMTVLQSLREKNAEDHLVLASIFAARGNENEIRKHLDSVPDDPSTLPPKRNALARCAFVRGNFAEAYRIWSALGDTSADTRYNTGIAALEMRDYTAALTIAEELAKRAAGPDRSEVLRLAGNAAVHLKEWEKARTCFAELSRSSPGSVVYYNHAVACYNLGEVEEAWRSYSRARELDSSIANKDIENRYSALKNPQPAPGRTELDSMDILYNKAVSLQSGGKEGEAEQLYRAIVKKDPRHARAHNNLGALCAARGELRDAERHYQRAIKAGKDLPEAYANLVAVYLAQEEIQKARDWTGKARAAYPHSELLLEIQRSVEQASAGATR